MEMSQNQKVRERPFFAESTKSYFSTLKNLQKNTKEALPVLHEEDQSKGRLSNLHSKLQQEADKIRRWKTQTELELKGKDEKIIEASQTIENLRKSALELQLENENLSQKFQEEIINREEITQRIKSTRDMCALLKDFGAKLDDRLQKCETERTELKYMEMDHKRNLEALSTEFLKLEINTDEKLKTLQINFDEEQKSSETKKEAYDENLALLKEKVIELEKMLEASDITTQDMKKMLNESATKYDNLKKEYDNLVTVLTEKSEAIILHEKSSIELIAEVDKYKKKNEVLEGELAILNTKQTEAIVANKEMEIYYNNKQKADFNRIKDLEVTVERQNINLTNCRKRIEELEIRMVNSAVIIKELNNEKDTLKRERNVTHKVAVDLESFKKSAVKNLQELKDKLSNLSSDKIVSDEEVVKLQQKLSEAEKVMEDSKRERTELVKQLTNQDQIIGDSYHEIKCKQENCNQLQCELQALHERESFSKEQIILMKSKLEKESDNYQAVLKEVEKLKVQKESIQSKLYDANTDIQKLQKELEKSMDNENIASSKVDSLTGELQALRHCSTELEHKIETEKKQNQKALMEEHDKVRNIEEKFEEQIDQLKTEKAKKGNLESELQKKLKDIEHLQNEVRKLEEKCEEQNSLFKSEKGKNENLASELQTKLEDIKHLEKETLKLEENLKNVDQEKNGIRTKCEYDLKRMADILDRNQTENHNMMQQKDKEMQDLVQRIKCLNDRERETSSIKEDLEKSNVTYEALKTEYTEKMESWEIEKSELAAQIKSLEENMKKKDSQILSMENLLAEQQARSSLKGVEDELSLEHEPVEHEQFNVTNEKLHQNYQILSEENYDFLPLNAQSRGKETCKSSASLQLTSCNESTPVLSRVPLSKTCESLHETYIQKTPKQDVLKTPLSGTGGILRMANNSVTKKRRSVVFASPKEKNEENFSVSSSSELMELKLDEVENTIKSKTKRLTTPLGKTKRNENLKIIGNNGTPLIRNPNGSLLKEIKKSPSLKVNPNVRKTPSRSGGKYFKSSPAERRNTIKNKTSKAATLNETAWFDSDAIFGFGPED